MAVPKDDADLTVLNSVSGLHGKEFDTAYIKKVGLAGHEKAVAAFQTEADGGQNADLKKVAQEALPTIKAHLVMPQQFAPRKGIPTQ